MNYFQRLHRSVTSKFAVGVFCLISIALSSAQAQAQAQAQGMPTQQGTMQGGAAPENARDPNANSGGYEYRGMEGWEETDEMVFSKIISDQLEYRNNEGVDTFRWDIQGWRGTDYKKLWMKFEGDKEEATSTGELELQALYSRTIAPFWDFQLGGRFDRSQAPGVSRDRFLGVIGFQGLAPYWFELEPALFISEDGDLSARLVGTYDLRITQRLILQPRFETNISASSVPDFGVGSGLNDVQLGFRLRYEHRRKFAPYLGVRWDRKFGNTADMVRVEGGDVDNFSVVAGLRLWF